MKVKNILCAAVSAMLFTGCAASAAAQDSITVLSREDGSGTRGAFTELFEIEEDGTDLTVADAEITNSTAVMISTVAGNENAIGYISLGSLSDEVKALRIDGVEASVETVKDGSYSVRRPFLIVTSSESEEDELTQDFISYISSTDGASVIEEAGYIAPEATETYTVSNLSGSITVGGSSSVTPVMEKLAEAYMNLNPSASITVQMSDSTTGASSTLEGVYQIGMLSREMSDDEKSAGLNAIVIAEDGIAVIVNNNNEVSDISKEQVKEIYTGTITTWEEEK